MTPLRSRCYALEKLHLFGEIAGPWHLARRDDVQDRLPAIFIRANVALVAPRRRRLTGRAVRLLPRAARVPVDGRAGGISGESPSPRLVEGHVELKKISLRREPLSRCKHCPSSRTPHGKRGTRKRESRIRRRSLSFRSDHVPGRLRWATNRGRGVETRVKSAVERADGPRTQGSLSLLGTRRSALSRSRVSLDLSPVHGHNQHRNAGIARRAATFPAGTHQVGDGTRLLLAGGMLNITAMYSRIISATGRPRCRRGAGEARGR